MDTHTRIQAPLTQISNLSPPAAEAVIDARDATVVTSVVGDRIAVVFVHVRDDIRDRVRREFGHGSFFSVARARCLPMFGSTGLGAVRGVSDRA